MFRLPLRTTFLGVAALLLPVALAGAVALGLAVALGVAVAVPVGVPVALAVAEAVPVREAVAVALRPAVVVRVGVAAGAGGCVAGPPGPGTNARVGVAAALRVGVAVAVRLGVRSGVSVAVAAAAAGVGEVAVTVAAFASSGSSSWAMNVAAVRAEPSAPTSVSRTAMPPRTQPARPGRSSQSGTGVLRGVRRVAPDSSCSGRGGSHGSGLHSTAISGRRGSPGGGRVRVRGSVAYVKTRAAYTTQRRSTTPIATVVNHQS